MSTQPLVALVAKAGLGREGWSLRKGVELCPDTWVIYTGAGWSPVQLEALTATWEPFLMTPSQERILLLRFSLEKPTSPWSLKPQDRCHLAGHTASRENPLRPRY